jgi:hypothetical protein
MEPTMQSIMEPTMQTDRTIPNNKTRHHNDKQGTCMLMDVAIHGDSRNVIKKEAEKILKYNDLIMEIQRMGNVKVKVILVIMEENGTIS